MANQETQIKNAKVLLVGLGGTGSRVVNNVLKTLQDRNITYNTDDVCFTVLDTNQNDVDDIIESGTNIPVVETSKNQQIRDYLADLNHLKPLRWFPNYEPIFEESMLDGASQMRMKSRMGFLGTLNDGDIKELEDIINNILNVAGETKVRVMIVSSLSGGTGSGMFIQTAIWLRNYFASKGVAITIKGIFLLPDIFVETLDAIRKNKLHTVRHYANAYAAIRELNAITRIKTGKPLLPVNEGNRITIDNIFDSIDNVGSKKPVFDFAFFIDRTTKSGSSLKDLGAYERMTAQLVYMQLFAPMVTDIHSQEDNTYLGFVDSEEPLYGSCGTSKAVYPVDDVVQYCALRATEESMKNGWSKIDDEIAAIKSDEIQRELDGEYGRPKIDPRAKFIQLFEEKIAKTGKEIGKFRLFTTIAKDICNETSETTKDGMVEPKYTDKVSDFCSDFENIKIAGTVAEKMAKQKALFLLDDDWDKEEHDVDSLVALVNEKEGDLEDNIRFFDKNANIYAEEIARSIMPLDMGDINADNEISLYGMFVKKNTEGQKFFVHPLAARYMLYKLEDELRRKITGEGNIEELRIAVLKGYGEGEEAINFDNSFTGNKEETPRDYLASKKGVQRASRFCAHFSKQYLQFNRSQNALFEIYMRAVLRDAVIKELLPKIKELSEIFEKFFKSLGDVSKAVKNEIEVNIEKNEDTSEKTLFVCADRFEKAAIYNNLGVDVSKSNTVVNKSVVDAVYGKFCFDNRPSSDENKAYGKFNVAETFLLSMVRVYGEDIMKDHKERIDFDIYTALCLEKDINNAAKTEEETFTLSVDLATGKKKDELAIKAKYAQAIADCVATLRQMASPFLLYSAEETKGELGLTSTLTDTFWGFHPDVVKVFPALGQLLGINADIQRDKGYKKNELFCYHSVYGIGAKYIPNFNEMNNGMYYKCYRTIVDKMVRLDPRTGENEHSLVQSPHLDKTWHGILPYVTTDKQDQVDDEFYRAFWLAIAYGKITLSAKGNYRLNRRLISSRGTETTADEDLRYNGKLIAATDVMKLIAALKNDNIFGIDTVPHVLSMFAAEKLEMDTYVNTKVFKGLTKSGEDLNPVTIITRYNSTRGKDTHVTGKLIAALESILGELAENYDMVRSEEQIEVAKYTLCKRVLDSAKRVDGKAEAFGIWEEKFKELGIKTTGAKSEKKPAAKKSSAKKPAAKKTTTKKSTKKAADDE